MVSKPEMSETLGYLGKGSVWYSWGFKSKNVELLVTAALALLLSYQAAALVYDIAFGLKKRSTARVYDLHMLLLVRKSSLTAVAANLARRDWITRIYYGRKFPRKMVIARENQRIMGSVVLKLVLLLALAPVVSVLTVFLSLSRTTTITFSEAGLKGIGIAVNDSRQPVNGTSSSGFCEHIPIEVAEGDSALATFSTCFVWTAPSTAPEEVANYIDFSVFSEFQLIVKAALGTRRRDLIFTAGLSTAGSLDEKLYRIQLNFSEQDALRAVDQGIQLLRTECKASDNGTRDFTPHTNSRMNRVVRTNLTCTDDNEADRKLLGALQAMRDVMYATTSEDMRVGILGDDSTISFGPPDNIICIQRRRKRVGTLMLIVICVVVVILRLTVAVVCNNDVGSGLVHIITTRLGGQSCLSLIRNSSAVCFSNMYMWANIAHYGLPRGGMRAVNDFTEGVIGGTVNEDLDESSLNLEQERNSLHAQFRLP